MQKKLIVNHRGCYAIENIPRGVMGLDIGNETLNCLTLLFLHLKLFCGMVLWVFLKKNNFQMVLKN